MLSAMYNQREDYGENVGGENTTDPKKKDILQYSPDTSASQQDVRKEPETSHQESWEKAVAAGGIFMPGAQE